MLPMTGGCAGVMALDFGVLAFFLILHGFLGAGVALVGAGMAPCIGCDGAAISPITAGSGLGSTAGLPMSIWFFVVEGCFWLFSA